MEWRRIRSSSWASTSYSAFTWTQNTHAKRFTHHRKQTNAIPPPHAADRLGAGADGAGLWLPGRNICDFGEFFQGRVLPSVNRSCPPHVSVLNRCDKRQCHISLGQMHSFIFWACYEQLRNDVDRIDRLATPFQSQDNREHWFRACLPKGDRIGDERLSDWLR